MNRYDTNDTNDDRVGQLILSGGVNSNLMLMSIRTGNRYKGANELKL